LSNLNRSRIGAVVTVVAASLGLGLAGGSACAAQLAGVSLPASTMVGSTNLVLNGIGLRTYSAFAIHIYVAGLYLEAPNHDGDAIISSPGMKVLRIHFVHDVGVAQIRRAWTKGLTDNCIAPCTLPAQTMSNFLASMQPVHAGEDLVFLFTPDGLTVTDQGNPKGEVHDIHFAQLMLAAFIGPHPATMSLKEQLLGNETASN